MDEFVHLPEDNISVLCPPAGVVAAVADTRPLALSQPRGRLRGCRRTANHSRRGRGPRIASAIHEPPQSGGEDGIASGARPGVRHESHAGGGYCSGGIVGFLQTADEGLEAWSGGGGDTDDIGATKGQI